MNKKIVLSTLIVALMLASPLFITNHSLAAIPNDNTIKPAQDYEIDATLKLGLGWWPDLLNPVSSETAYDWDILGLIFDSLTGSHPFDMQNTTKDLGWLAESWTREIKEVNASELLGTNATEYFGDGLPEVRNVSIWHVTLRDNVTWHDGTPFTADDVVFTYEFINWTQSDQWYETWSNWLYVNKTGTYSVDIWVKDDGFFNALQVLGILPLPKHIYGNAQTWGEGYTGTFPDWDVPVDVILGYKPKSATDPILTGTGPFKLQAWYPEQPDPSLADTFVLRRYDDYYFRAVDAQGNEVVPWADAQLDPNDPNAPVDQHGPYIKELHFIVTTDPAVAFDRLRAEIIDMAAEFEFGFYVGELQKLGFTIETKDRLGFGHVTVNSAGYSSLNATSYAKFRRAIAYAIDKTEITDRAWAGYARPIDLPVPPSQGIWSIEDQLTEHYYDANPQAALDLLAELGITDSDNDGWLEWPDGSEITLVFTGTSSSTVQIIMDVVRESLEAIGIHLDMRVMNFNALIDSWFSGQFDLTFFGWSLGRFPTILNIWVSSHPYNIWIYRWANDTYDEAVNNMVTARTLDDALQYAHQAELILYYEQPIIPVYQNLIPGAYNPDKWKGVYSVLGAPVVNTWTILKVVKKKPAVTIPWSISGFEYSDVGLVGGTVDTSVYLDLTGSKWPSLANFSAEGGTVEIIYWFSGEASSSVAATYNGLLGAFVASIPVGQAGIFYMRPKVTDPDGNVVYGDAVQIYVYGVADVSYPSQVSKYETATIGLTVDSPFDYNLWTYIDPSFVTIWTNATGDWEAANMTYDSESGQWTYSFTPEIEGLVFFYFEIADPYGNTVETSMYNFGVGVPPLPTILSVSAPTEGLVGSAIEISATVDIPTGVTITGTLIWWYEGDTTNNTVTMTLSGNTLTATITPDKAGTIHYIIEIVDSEGRTVQSSEGTIEISTPPTPGIPPLVVGGIVIGFLVILGALVVFLRKRE